MRSLWLLLELGVPFKLKTHAFDKSLRAPDFLGLSPAGRVPALEIEGQRMFETGAITEYLCETFSPDDLGRMPGTAERMDWLVWLHFSETVSQHIAALTQQHVVLREDHMRSATVMKLEAARLTKCYDALEQRLATPSQPRAYLLTSGFSAADVSVGQAIYMARYFAPLDQHPAVAAWYASISSRPAFQEALPKPGEGIYGQDFYAPWPV